MVEVGKRLRVLREGARLSQTKLGTIIGSSQSSINRYESGQASPTIALLRAYADYFDVSMDYIFARTEHPQGKLYGYNPNVMTDTDEFKEFVDMCFDPESPVSAKLKDTLYKLAKDENSSK